MGLGHSPRIITDGLVFAVDVNNKEKSWRGRKNLAKTSAGVADWTIGNLTAAVSRTEITANERYQITCTVSGAFRFYFNVANLINGGTYTMSFKYRYITATTSDFALTDWCDTGITTTSEVQTDGIYYSGTGTRATYDATYRFMDAFMSSGQTIEIWDVQLEERSSPTTYVSNLLSSTEQLLDLTNTNTITVSSLTYDSNGDFNFNGSNSFSIPSINFSTGQTIEIWLKPTENDAVRRNPYNQAYGGYGTWTHETSGVINYYYGDAGANTTPYIGHQSSFTVLQDEIACVCTTRDLTKSVWFKNGVEYNTFNHSYADLLTDNNPIIIGTGYAGGYIGNIYAVKLYNRALTASEVSQNFNALKGRYGL